MAKDTTVEFQEQTLRMLRMQQQAYLEAVKAWRSALASGLKPPPLPETTGLDALPSASEVAEASYAFAAKLIEEQGRFLQSLSRAMADSGGES